MGRTRYFKQDDRDRQNIIRAAFVAPVKHLGFKAVELTDYDKGVPEDINTGIYYGEDLFGVTDTRWRDGFYNLMDFSKKDGYNPLAKFKKRLPNYPAFVLYGFGWDKVKKTVPNVRAWIFDPNVKLLEKVGGRIDRDDSLDIENEVRLPYDDLKTPEEIWKSVGLI